MIELIQITNDPAFARRCDALGGFRLFVDLERLGKAERQAGRNTFISAHSLEDVGRIKRVLRQSPLMVRVNPLHDGTPAEVEAVLAGGADQLMLPMFEQAAATARISRGSWRAVCPSSPCWKPRAALQCLDEWIATPGLAEVYVGLNDLHLSLGHRFMFEPLALGMVDRVAAAARAARPAIRLRWHRKGRRGHAARTRRACRAPAPGLRLRHPVANLPSGRRQRSLRGRGGEAARRPSRNSQRRTPAQVEGDAHRIAALIGRIAAGMGPVA